MPHSTNVQAAEPETPLSKEKDNGSMRINQGIKQMGRITRRIARNTLKEVNSILGNNVEKITNVIFEKILPVITEEVNAVMPRISKRIASRIRSMHRKGELFK